jgi:hypothetical protein
LTSAITNVGIRIDGASTNAIWLGAGSAVTTAADGITFGSGKDVNLYRSGNDTLKTDDSLTIGADLDHDGSSIGFFSTAPTTQQTALTAADASVINGIFDVTESGVLENLRTRVDELETKLQAYGLLA